MTPTTTENVVEILTTEGGYRELPRPLMIGNLSFDFPHALVPTEGASDLVVVVELRSDGDDEAEVRRILSLTRALDVLESRRSVTAVITIAKPSAPILQSMSRVCRVLPIGTASGPKARDEVRDWLSVLLPLEELQADEAATDWQAALRAAIPEDQQTGQFDDLLEAAQIDKQAVEEVFAEEMRLRVVDALHEEDAAGEDGEEDADGLAS